MQADRRGQASSTLSAVTSRHAAIQKIERDMAELSTLFVELNEKIIVQEAQVQQIETQAQAVETDVAGANVELAGAVTKARAARRKKWICLGIVGKFEPLPLRPSACCVWGLSMLFFNAFRNSRHHHRDRYYHCRRRRGQ